MQINMISTVGSNNVQSIEASRTIIDGNDILLTMSWLPPSSVENYDIEVYDDSGLAPGSLLASQYGITGQSIEGGAITRTMVGVNLTVSNLSDPLYVKIKSNVPGSELDYVITEVLEV